MEEFPSITFRAICDFVEHVLSFFDGSKVLNDRIKI
jgi:hypothetical protein